MLEGGAKDEDKRDTIPEGHCFAEHGCKWGGGLGVRAVVQSSQLRVDECSHGELISRHDSRYGSREYIVGNRHRWIGCSSISVRRRKMEVDRSFENGTYGFRHE